MDGIRITSPRDGDILNHTDGEQDAGGLWVEVSGTCSLGAKVRVNGRRAAVSGSTFRATLRLVNEKTRIKARIEDGPFDAGHDIQVLWDRRCFPRYRFSTDDNVWFLRDIGRDPGAFPSLFDHPYLALWKRLRDTYGTSVQHNIYLEAEDGWTLREMPDSYRGEWRDNADWLKLAFHARANDPDLPYQDATYERAALDFEEITGEIVRFAGEEVLTSFTTIHWGRATRDACLALRDRGICGFACPYPDTWPHDPPIAYYLDTETIAHAQTRDYWWDTEADLLFIAYDLCCNMHRASDFPGILERRAADPRHSQLMEVMIHEQYFYPDYAHHLPDYAHRVETCVRWLTEHGYRSIQHDDGFLGA